MKKRIVIGMASFCITVAAFALQDEGVMDLFLSAAQQAATSTATTPYSLGTPVFYFDFSDTTTMYASLGTTATNNGIVNYIVSLTGTSVWYRYDNGEDSRRRDNAINGNTLLDFGTTLAGGSCFTNYSGLFATSNFVTFYVFSRPFGTNLQNWFFAKATMPSFYDFYWYYADRKIYNYFSSGGQASAVMNNTGSLFYASCIRIGTSTTNVYLNGTNIALTGSSPGIAGIGVDSLGGYPLPGANQTMGYLMCAILWTNTTITQTDLGRLMTNWAIPKWGTPSP